jgi:hypothetical protein
MAALPFIMSLPASTGYSVCDLTTGLNTNLINNNILEVNKIIIKDEKITA